MSDAKQSIQRGIAVDSNKATNEKKAEELTTSNFEGTFILGSVMIGIAIIVSEPN